MNIATRYIYTALLILIFTLQILYRYSFDDGPEALRYMPPSFPPHVIHILGYFSSPNDAIKRNRIRKYIKSYHNVYNEAQHNGSVGIVFVICVYDLMATNKALQLELDRYGDIVILNQEENMNSGKTWSWFTTAWTIFGRKNPNLRFIGKCDQDTFIRVAALEMELNNIWKTGSGNIYYGRSIRMYWKVPTFYYMSGMAYFLSRDLVQWVANSWIARKYRVGHEDLQVGFWFKKSVIKVQHINGGRSKFHDWKGHARSWDEIEAAPSNESIVIHRSFSDDDFLELRRIFKEPL